MLQSEVAVGGINSHISKTSRKNKLLPKATDDKKKI